MLLIFTFIIKSFSPEVDVSIGDYKTDNIEELKKRVTEFSKTLKPFQTHPACLPHTSYAIVSLKGHQYSAHRTVAEN